MLRSQSKSLHAWINILALILCFTFSWTSLFLIIKKSSYRNESFLQHRSSFNFHKSYISLNISTEVSIHKFHLCTTYFKLLGSIQRTISQVTYTFMLSFNLSTNINCIICIFCKQQIPWYILYEYLNLNPHTQTFGLWKLTCTPSFRRPLMISAYTISWYTPLCNQQN